MKPLAVCAIAEAVGGRLNENADALPRESVATGVQIDSRRIAQGDLFVACGGERVDGHDFAVTAVDAGARVVLAERDLPQVPCIVVHDSLAALGALAAWYRREILTAKVIGVTGSSGKTTTKDLIAQTLDGQVVAAPGSFNTEFGVPLTVLQADTETEYLVLEMGMRGLGHIRYLADLVDPDIAVVLNVGTAHAGMLDDVSDIARAKGELVEGLRDDAVAVLNADDPQVSAMVDRTSARVLWFGEGPTNDVCALEVRVDSAGRAGFELAIRGQSPQSVQLTMHGEHFVSSALAAAAVAYECGMPVARIAELLSAATSQSPWRMEVRPNGAGITVINDAYNANPESMRAALKTLRSMDVEGRTWAVVGEMRELGDLSTAQHDAIGRLAVRLDISRLVCVGPATKVMHLAASNEGSWGEESIWVPDVDAAIELLDQQLRPGDVVLVKASRAVGLEVIAAHLLGDGGKVV